MKPDDILILFMFVLLTLFAAINGFFIKSATTKDFQARKVWHILGFVFRVLLLALVIYVLRWNWWTIGLVTLLYFNWSWTIYDLIINLIIGKKVFDSGITAEIDIILTNQVAWLLKGILFVGTVIYIVFYFIH